MNVVSIAVLVLLGGLVVAVGIGHILSHISKQYPPPFAVRRGQGRVARKVERPPLHIEE